MSNLLNLIKRHEGFRATPYWDKTGQEIWQGIAEQMYKYAGRQVTDELGHLTIGYGFNLEAPRSEAFWEYVLAWDVERAMEAAYQYDWFAALGSPLAYEEVSARQAVIISMIYQLGPTGFAGFKRMIAWIDPAYQGKGFSEFHHAADEMLDSKWARQTPERAQELAEMMRTGEWPSWMEKAA